MNENDRIDFAELGERLASSLIVAAEEQVQRAQQILDQTRSMAEIIRNQVAVQAKQIEDMNARFKAFGNQMLDAHRMLNGEQAPAADPDQLRTLADLERSYGSIRSIAGADIPVVAAKPKDRDGSELPRALGSRDPHAAAVAGPGRYARNNGTGSGGSGERAGTDPLAAGSPYRETSRD